MDIQHWSDILDRLPRALRQLRDPVSEHRLRELEAQLGTRLPGQYRSFLRRGDGGWLGEFQILGCQDLRWILDSLDLTKPCRLLPFHPVSQDSFECLDLVTERVLWCSFADAAPGATEEDCRCPFFLGLHPLATRILDPDAAAPQVQRQTYEDFLDWILDALWGLHFPPGIPALLGREPARN
ncbi:MAG: SMI1/KNR4 family protein [Planctomycetota bacterium]